MQIRMYTARSDYLIFCQLYASMEKQHDFIYKAIEWEGCDLVHFKIYLCRRYLCLVMWHQFD